MNWDALFARRALGIQLGLESIAELHACLGKPAAGIPAIHVVGTNGKGSTAAMSGHALQRFGYRVGLYTSPHLHTVNERVRIDGIPIAESELRRHVDTVLGNETRARVPRPLSFFEVLTLAALLAFEDARVDVLVVEAGLGARHDATRIVNAHQVVITNVALDHEQLLGTGLGAIAGEKAQAMRAGVPCWSALQQPEARQVLERHARTIGCPFISVPPLDASELPLEGDHQRQNAALALAATKHFAPAVSVEDLAGLHWPGRFERVVVGPTLMVLDVAHNPHGVAALVDHVRAAKLAAPITIVFGCMPDKDHHGMLAALRTLDATWWSVSLARDSHRAESAAACFADPTSPALMAALARRLTQGGTVLVCGSHALVGSVRQAVLGVHGEAHPGDPMPGR